VGSYQFRLKPTVAAHGKEKAARRLPLP
jgi:hypothetical protein